jgi:hypothetical protein
MQFCVNRTLALYGTRVTEDRGRKYCLASRLLSMLSGKYSQFVHGLILTLYF